MKRPLAFALASAFLAIVAASWLLHPSEVAGLEIPAAKAAPASPTGAAGVPAPAEVAEVPERSAAVETSRRASSRSEAAQPAPAGFVRLQVRVLASEDDTPVQHVAVIAGPAGWERKRLRGYASYTGPSTSVTDGDGRIELVLAPDSLYRLHAYSPFGEKGGAEAEVGPWSADARVEHVLHVPTRLDLPFTGLVVDGAGTPIAGAQVTLVTEFDPQNRPLPMPAEDLRVARSDANGLFRVELASWRSATLLVEAEGFSPLTVSPGRGHERAPDAARMALSRAGMIVFRALDRVGVPLRDATIHVECASDVGVLMAGPRDERLRAGPFPPLKWRRELDVDGSCTLRDVPVRRSLTLSLYQGVRELRHEPDRLALDPGETREITWRIGGGCRVSGDVVDQLGQPMTGLDVCLIWGHGDEAPTMDAPEKIVDRVISDARGRFVLEDVPVGPWSIGPPACTSGCDYYPLATRLEVTEGMETAHVSVRVARGLFVNGRVEDPDGRPLSNVRVELLGLPLTRAYSTAMGKFRLGPLPPVERGWITAECSECPFARSQPVEVTVPGGPSEVVLRMRPAGTISGHVRDARTGSDVDADVSASSQDAEGGSSAHAQGGGEHPFTLDRLLPGRYTLRAQTADGLLGFVAGVRLEDGRPVVDVSISVRQPATLRFDGAAITEDHRIEALVDGVVWDDCFVMPGDTCELRIPHGAVTLRSTTQEGAVLRGILDLQIDAGEVRQVDVARIGG